MLALDVVDFSGLQEEPVGGFEVDPVEVGVSEVLQQHVAVVAVEGDLGVKHAPFGHLQNSELTVTVRQVDPIQLGLQSADSQVKLKSKDKRLTQVHTI